MIARHGFMVAALLAVILTAGSAHAAGRDCDEMQAQWIAGQKQAADQALDLFRKSLQSTEQVFDGNKSAGKGGGSPVENLLSGAAGGMETCLSKLFDFGTATVFTDDLLDEVLQELFRQFCEITTAWIDRQLEALYAGINQQLPWNTERYPIRLDVGGLGRPITLGSVHVSVSVLRNPWGHYTGQPQQSRSR